MVGISALGIKDALEMVVKIKASGLSHIEDVVRDEKGHAPSKILLLRQILFLTVGFNG